MQLHTRHRYDNNNTNLTIHMKLRFCLQFGTVNLWVEHELRRERSHLRGAPIKDGGDRDVTDESDLEVVDDVDVEDEAAEAAATANTPGSAAMFGAPVLGELGRPGQLCLWAYFFFSCACFFLCICVRVVCALCVGARRAGTTRSVGDFSCFLRVHSLSSTFLSVFV
jgi:hypothetical protein